MSTRNLPHTLEQDRCACRCIHPEKIAAAARNALSDGENKEMAALFKALADPTRLRILRALAGQEMCVCDLAQLAGVSESAISHQLRQLRQLQLVCNRRSGPILYYRLADDHVTQLMEVALAHLREKE
jgi:DNA-binding transcriptional ArsR family regulator